MKDLSVTVKDSFIYMYMQLLRYASISLVNIDIYIYTCIYMYIRVCVGRKC